MNTNYCWRKLLSFEEMKKHTTIINPLPCTEKRLTFKIEDLPTEVLEVIMEFLGAQDLGACFNVSIKWRNILNKNAIWKKHCLYDEKYYIHCKSPIGAALCGYSEEMCVWKQCYDREQTLLVNWARNKFTTEDMAICATDCLTDLVDDKGYHWILQYNSNAIHVWDITKTAKLHTSFHSDDSSIGLCVSKNNIVLHRSDYIKVLKFEYPKYELSPAFRFIFDGDHVLKEDSAVSEDYYTSFSRHLVVDKYFVGYYENIPDIKSCKFHVWDLSSAEKVATPDIYQQSFVEFVRSSSNTDITDRFNGGLLLFGCDESTDILVATIDDDHGLCQVSLFSLEDRHFVNIIVQLISKRVWCFMSNGVVAIHSLVEDHSIISVYDTSGNPLTSLNLSFCHNPAFSNQFWFSGSKMFLSQTNKITIVDIKGEVNKWDFDVVENHWILGFYEPRFLLLFKKSATGDTQNYVISVWDILSGTFLYNLADTNVQLIGCYKSWFANSKFPGKVVVPKNSDYLSVKCFL